MSNATIDQVYVDGFRDAVRQLAQQKFSKLRSWCDEFSPEAQTGNWDRLGKADAIQKTRKMATPEGGRVWSRRIAVATPYNDAEITEVEDPSLMLIDPNSNLVQSLGYSMGRSMDDVIISACKGNALNSVRDGSGGNAPTSIPVPGSQIVGDYTTPISFDMVTEAIEIFSMNDIDLDQPKVAVVSPRQVRELMNLTEVTSSDYVQAQALQRDGIVPNWMGFTWITSTRLNIGNTTAQGDILFLSKKAMGFHIPQDVTAFVERDPSLSYAWRPYCQWTGGAVRVEDEHLVWGKVLDSTVA